MARLFNLGPPQTVESCPLFVVVWISAWTGSWDTYMFGVSHIVTFKHRSCELKNSDLPCSQALTIYQTQNSTKASLWCGFPVGCDAYLGFLLYSKRGFSCHPTAPLKLECPKQPGLIQIDNTYQPSRTSTNILNSGKGISFLSNTFDLLFASCEVCARCVRVSIKEWRLWNALRPRKT